MTTEAMKKGVTYIDYSEKQVFSTYSEIGNKLVFLLWRADSISTGIGNSCGGSLGSSFGSTIADFISYTSRLFYAANPFEKQSFIDRSAERGFPYPRHEGDAQFVSYTSFDELGRRLEFLLEKSTMSVELKPETLKLINAELESDTMTSIEIGSINELDTYVMFITGLEMTNGIKPVKGDLGIEGTLLGFQCECGAFYQVSEESFGSMGEVSYSCNECDISFVVKAGNDGIQRSE